MKKFYLFIFILTLFFLQYSVLGVFFRIGRIPNLFVSFTAGLAVLFGFKRSVGWVILAGLLMDSGSFWLFGSGAFLLVAILWFIEKIRVVAELRSGRYYFIALFFLLVFFFSFLFDVTAWVGVRAESHFFQNVPNIGSSAANSDYFFKYFYSAVFGMGVYYFVRKAKARPAPFLPAQKTVKK